MRQALGKEDADDATDTIPDRGPARHREDHRGSAHRGRRAGTSAHEGRVDEGPLRLANPSSASDVIEGRLIDIGLRALELGINVVVDYGLWGKDERSALRQAAADLGAAVEMRYFELTPAEQRTRLDRRQAEGPHTTWRMSDEDLSTWAAIISVPTPGELDGSEPIDGPPPGFANWDDWRRHRWPSSIS